MIINPLEEILANPLFKKMMDAGQGNAAIFQNRDAAVSGGMAFLTSELARRDPKLHEPLTSIIWPRDIEATLGGGFIDFTEVEYVRYGIAGPNEYGLSGNVTTQIPTVSTDIQKDIYRVFNWQNNMEVSHIDLQKANTIGRSLDNLLNTAIKLNYQKAVEKIVYTGWVGTPGLLNNTGIAAAAAALGASGFTAWNTKTPDEIVADINSVMLSTVTASGYDLSGMASHILLPWAQYNYIVTQKVSSAGNCSILTYIMENNLAKNQGVTLEIHPCRWCTGAGSGGSDRMLGYVRSKDKLQFDLPVPLTRMMTVPNINNGCTYQTAYVAQIGVVKFLYLQPACYVDGI